MTLRLRPHHLLCVLTYVGKRYGEAFTANYDVVAKRLADGEEILVVEGPDDICAPLLDEADAHCLHDTVTERDRHAARDVGALLGMEIVPGGRLRPDAGTFSLMREAFSRGRTRSACLGCEWSDLCDTVAAERYHLTRLRSQCD